MQRLRSAWLGGPDPVDWIPVILLLLLWLGLAFAGWGAWVDPHIDDGRELQLPVEIASGKLLYRDVLYSYGPIVPYFHALLVMAAGPRIETFFVLGLVLSLSVSLLIYAVMRLFTVPAFAFVPATIWTIGGLRPDFYDTVVPYSYAAVHGILITLLALWLACTDIRLSTCRYLRWTSLLAGVAVLTKVEFAVPCVAIAFLHGLSFGWKKAALALAGPALGVAVFLAHFQWLGVGFMLEDNLNWTPRSYYFRHYGPASLINAFWNTKPKEAVLGLVWCGGFLLAAAAIFSRIPARFCWLIAAGGVAALWWRGPSYFLTYAIVSPVDYWLCLAITLYGAYRVMRGGRVDWGPGTLACLTAMLVALRAAAAPNILRVFLPFSIPMVMAAVAIAWIVATAVAARSRRSLHPAPFAALLLGALICVYAERASGRPIFWMPEMSAVSGIRGSILVPTEQAPAMREALSFLSAARARGEAVWVMPEDMLLSYLSGSAFPYRQYQFLPGMPAPGHWTGRFLAEVSRRPAPWALLCTRPFGEYGVHTFGQDFHQDILDYPIFKADKRETDFIATRRNVDHVKISIQIGCRSEYRSGQKHICARQGLTLTVSNPSG